MQLPGTVSAHDGAAISCRPCHRFRRRQDVVDVDGVAVVDPVEWP
jgi:hypothetical protein